MKLLPILLLPTSLLFSDFQERLDNDPRTKNEAYYKKIGGEIDRNHAIIKDLLTRNKKCVEGTEKMIKHATCYAVYLSIQDLKAEGESENKDLINQLAKNCPDWRKYNDIEDCK